ncbi:hypothetical protein IFR05_005664, partial [Cadophora sp. M221]
MRAITLLTPQTYDLTNQPTSLTLTTLPLPTPSESQVLLRITATAITPYELSWPAPPSAPTPRIPAHDVAGTVISSASPLFKAEDEVFALLPYDGQGGMAEYAVCDVRFLARMPKGMEAVEAASVPRATLTALQACGGLEGGERVLVMGGTGAVGRMAVQLARRGVGERGVVVAVGGFGCKVLEGLGASLVVNYKEVEGGRWEDIVRKRVEGGEIDVLVDCLGGESLERGTEL